MELERATAVPSTGPSGATESTLVQKPMAMVEWVPSLDPEAVLLCEQPRRVWLFESARGATARRDQLAFAADRIWYQVACLPVVFVAASINHFAHAAG